MLAVRAYRLVQRQVAALSRKPPNETKVEIDTFLPTELFYYSSPSDYAWDQFPLGSNLQVLLDKLIKTRNVTAAIETVHREGFLHKGAWVAVVRAPVRTRRVQFESDLRDVLLLRRSNDTATCPGAWGFVGEHSLRGEGWRDTAVRGMREELRLLGQDLRAGDLTPGKSLLVRTDLPGTTRRRDLQATKLFLATLRGDQAEQIVGDMEVSEFRWARLPALAEELKRKEATVAFCTAELQALAQRLVKLIVDRGVPLPPRAAPGARIAGVSGKARLKRKMGR